MGLLNIKLNFMAAPVVAVALGIAVDDTIHFLSKLKFELKTEKDFNIAVKKTILSAGKPIIITSIIFAIGFSVLVLSDFGFTQTFGLFIMFTVISAVLGDLFFLPVILMMIKPKGLMR